MTAKKPTGLSPTQLFFIAMAGQLLTVAIAGYTAYKTSLTHRLVNSEMTEFKELIGKSSRAEGVIEGKADEVKEAASRPSKRP